ncbi:Arb2 domain-containing protein [Trichoderma austrokoningii]
MEEPQYTVFIRVPIPRRGFVDPAPVSWDVAKDEALWKILSGHKEIDWNLVADRFEVPVDFLVQQVAYLNERHQSHFRAQVRKATAAVKGSATQSPVPGSDLAGPGHLRTPSALSIRRDVSGLRNESGIFASSTPVRPTMSRNTSATTTVMRDGGGASPRTSNKPSLRAAEQSGRTRLSSLPMESPVPRSPRSPRSPQQPAAEVDSANSPGPADNSSSSSSDDDSKPAQSRIIRRPPRYQQQESYSYGYQFDEDDESEPAFQPYNAPLSSPDMSSTLKQTDSGRNKPRRNPKAVAKSPYHSQTSDSSASSPAMVLRPPKTRDAHSAGPVSPRNAAEPASSEGDHSISSSFSDLDDASVTRSAMEEAYFVNDQDEIRSIQNPDNYFKYFLDRNPRVCARQRFEFNRAMEAIIHERLEGEGLQKVCLPVGQLATEPHIPIFVSPNLETRSRIVVIFGETTHDLGVLAGRVANGQGGINEGSAVPVVRAVKSQKASGSDDTSPGTILANMGQTCWWPEGQRALTVSANNAVPLPSLVHIGVQHVPHLHEIPGNKNADEHVEYVFTDFISGMASDEATVDIIATGESCEIVERFLDEERIWNVWGNRINTLVLLGPVYDSSGLKNEKFKDFMAKRGRAYDLSNEPVGTPLASPEGNLELSIPPLGLPCFSSSETMNKDTIFVRARSHILSYLQEVALDAEYENPPIVLADCPRPAMTDQGWEELPEGEKPVIIKMDPDQLKQDMRQIRRWKKFNETGKAPETDSETEAESEV